LSETATIYPTWAEETALSPEVRALLACARGALDEKNLAAFGVALAACPSVDRLCETAVAHGMLGHLHRLVTSGPDPLLAERLGELQRLSVQRNLRQTGYLLRVLELLRTAGVEAMPFKGPVWAKCLYDDIAMRSWADLDVIIRHEQVAAAREVLLAHGLVDASRFSDRITRLKKGGWGQVALSAGDRGVTLELHWEVTSGFSVGALQAESLLSRADHLQLLEREVLAPCAIDRLLITCLNGARDRWDSVEGLLGLAVQMRQATDPFWPDAVAAAQSAGCRRRLIVGVAHACRVFGLQIPAEVSGSLAQDSVARFLVRSLDGGSLSRGDSERRRLKLATIFWRSATEDSVAAGLRHVAVRFLRPGPEDWEAVALPPWAEWLHYLLRPFLLVAKRAKRL
jgi:hypothetical protein